MGTAQFWVAIRHKPWSFHFGGRNQFGIGVARSRSAVGRLTSTVKKGRSLASSYSRRTTCLRHPCDRC